MVLSFSSKPNKMPLLVQEIEAVAPSLVGHVFLEAGYGLVKVEIPDDTPGPVQNAVVEVWTAHDPTKLTPAEAQGKAINENRGKHKGKSYKTMNKPEQDDLILAVLQASGWADENGVLV